MDFKAENNKIEKSLIEYIDERFYFYKSHIEFHEDRRLYSPIATS